MPTNLIFDADDTLWENNVLFERAIEAFIDHLAHPVLSREQVREELDTIERQTVHEHGYGVNGFQVSLLACLEKLRDGISTEADQAAIATACEPIRRHDIELLDGVVDTLRELSGRHRLFLLTKGDAAEQTAKVAASGLADHFDDIGIVREKNVAAYRDFVDQRSLLPEETWMIGNSPMSDIHPALAAGLGAVLVPHPMTWSLEVGEFDAHHARFREVSPFAALCEHF